MADYSYISNDEIDPGSPLNTSLFSRLARNPEAIAEGDVDAPPIAAAALGRPTAGNVTRFLDDTTHTNDQMSFSVVYRFQPGGFGAFRVKMELRGISGLTAFAEVRVNGTAVLSFASAGTGWTARTGDVTFATGDLVEVYLRSNSTGADADLRNLEFATSGEDLYPITVNEQFWSFT
ncbi:hypothetical protein [Roseovarius sp. C03]|uniref:hypothetical protein n=1 Tax=Roseovarius sp. C03 TaxID=3449222 RepID=UPI003EDBC9FE